MDKWVRRIWEIRKGWLKQRTAVVLCVVLILQILLPGAAVRGIRAFGADTLSLAIGIHPAVIFYSEWSDRLVKYLYLILHVI